MLATSFYIDVPKNQSSSCGFTLYILIGCDLQIPGIKLQCDCMWNLVPEVLLSKWLLEFA